MKGPCDLEGHPGKMCSAERGWGWGSSLEQTGSSSPYISDLSHWPLKGAWVFSARNPPMAHSESVQVRTWPRRPYVSCPHHLSDLNFYLSLYHAVPATPAPTLFLPHTPEPEFHSHFPTGSYLRLGCSPLGFSSNVTILEKLSWTTLSRNAPLPFNFHRSH